MTKTAIAADEPKRVCPIHNVPLKYSQTHKMWYCKDCLYASFLTHQAQQASVKRYRQSKKGKAAERKYELSKKGVKAREKYLKSEKYKERRREYNLRLKESLQIARAVLDEKATKEKEEEKIRTEELMPLIQDIREYADTMGRLPSSPEVIKWAKDAYGFTLLPSRAIALINKAAKRRLS